MSLHAELQALQADVVPALELVRVPAILLDATGIVRWLNPAAERVFGDVRGHHYSDVVAPRDLGKARENFARKLLGEPVTDFAIDGVTQDGRELPLEVSSVGLRHDHRVVGVFGLLQTQRPPRPAPRVYRELTPRQHEVLTHLGEGCTTREIAREMGISEETVRNHVRGILRSFNVHTRLQAVAAAHGAGLLA